MCITPLTLKTPKANQSWPLPCGKCPECINKRKAGWAFRLQKEAEVSSSALFITLTYSTKHVPLSIRGYPTLQPEDVTLFLKRLRKKSKQKIKYYYCGEYGGQTHRPHYHMLIFNSNYDDIENTWDKGYIHYGTVEGGSIGYTLKYMCKNPKEDLQYWKKRHPQFARMSKGLGQAYLTEEIKQYHTTQHKILERQHLQMGQILIPMPRYYKNKIYNEQHKFIIQRDARIIADQKNPYPSPEALHKIVQSHLAQFNKMAEAKEKNKYL